ncbi:tetratricopeptide repeat protein [Desulfovibrio sp. TomC]|uniref:tetratricopeptide repeat protein n=1 Tax=Desulfovibrio sp. TomC TaxID=1562888 RepID=UPI000574F3CE|nr:tetratricopeptide repeat protein [Desulfovibrio sp. TomC]KHK02838.1 TPR repeat [Desulfovibrio sp. TomC]
MASISAAQQEEKTEVEGHSLGQCRILGVYSLVKAAATGHGATARTYEQKTMWFVRRSDDDEYMVQALNANSIPSGPLTTISKGDFIRSYQPEPGYYEKRCLPFIESLKKKLTQADKLLADEDLDGAEKEFCKALLLDEKNPKANIELGKIHLQKGDGKKLAAAMRRILSTDALFQEHERHLFNEFGISLRKEKHFAEAVSFYGKALEHNNTDEHLHFNIARALAESGHIDTARSHLETALALRPDFETARRFLDYLGKNGGAPADAGDSEGQAQ